jgi:transcription initiation factor TFIIIB Brf1 subunit/transcription initiation factor TFIIB
VPEDEAIVCKGCGHVMLEDDIVDELCGWCRDDDHPNDT